MAAQTSVCNKEEDGGEAFIFQNLYDSFGSSDTVFYLRAQTCVTVVLRKHNTVDISREKAVKGCLFV